MTMSHFVAWDGKVIYDQPFTSKVNETKDRTYPEMTNIAFAKLNPKSECTSWQIASMYQLVLHPVMRFINTMPENGPIIHLHKG